MTGTGFTGATAVRFHGGASPVAGLAGSIHNVLWLGDSLTHGLYATTQANTFQSLVGVFLTDLGVSATTVVDAGGGRTSTYFAGELPTISACDADLCFIEIGTNDCGVTSLVAFEANMRAIASAVIANRSHCTLIFMTVWDQGTLGVPYDAIINHVASDYAGCVVDLSPLYAVSANHEPAGVVTVFGTSDGWHPNDAGHAAIAEALEIALAAPSPVAATFKVVSDTQITATVPAGAGSGPIIVTAPSGSTTSTANFAVFPVPTIAALIPISGPVGSSVTLLGSGFTGTSKVELNGHAAAFTVDSDTQITTAVPAGAGSGPFAVTTPGGTATSAASFAVFPVPTLASFTPPSGRVGATVTLSGTGFVGATAVHFNGLAATTFSASGDTQISATVPAGATSGKITVTTPGGTATSAASFAVVPPPTVTALIPTSGALGDSVTLIGAGFAGASGVAFGGVTARFTVNSATQISATVPFGAGTGTITVTTPGGVATSAASFTVVRVTPKLTLKLSGLKKGVLKLGRRLTAKGTVTPVSLAGGKVTFTVQRKRDGKWRRVTSLVQTIGAGGACSWKCKPARRGSYRLRATIAKTGTNAAASAAWLTFKVI
ncbi:MAG: GDSL-type esterase/lipase family protein [Thermoleophilia bacterium]